MKNSEKNMMKLAIVILIVAIIILVGIIIKILNTNNEINRQKERNTQQLEETTTDNAYISMETHLSALDEKQKEINNMQNTAGQATITADKILKNYTAYKDGKLITGTMENRGTLNWNPSASTSYTVPAGYYSGGTLSSANAYNAGYNAGKSISMELLYSGDTYKNTSTAFTIQMDLSKYRAIYIPAVSMYPFISAVKSNDADFSYSTAWISTSDVPRNVLGHTVGRTVTVSTSGISFGQTYLYNINTRYIEATTANWACPTKIYGIK